MLVGGQYCFSPFFARFTLLLLLGVWSHALGAPPCKQQYGRVGETVVLSPGPIREPLILAIWKFNRTKIADMNADVSRHQFTGRSSMEKKNYNLTIQELRTTDSGDFTFVSEGNNGQRPTFCIRLSVQEVLTQSPKLTLINTTEISNESCEVLLECSSEYDKGVSYRWTVNNVGKNGSRLQYQLIPHDGDTTVTCTVSNMVSETSENKSISCQSPPSPKHQGDLRGFLIIAGIVCAVLVFTVALVVVWRYKRLQAAEAEDELTVYAEIDDTCSKIMKPCSVYETLEDSATTVKPQAQTVYDQIQFSRMQQPQNR